MFGLYEAIKNGNSNGMENAIKIWMDPAGRLVIPKSLRKEAGLDAGQPLWVRVRGGCVELEPVEQTLKIVRKGRVSVAVPLAPLEPMSDNLVQDIKDEVRMRRGST